MLRRSKLLGFIFVVCLLSFISPTLAWWNDFWTYRKPITIDNTGNSNDLTNYQVLVVLNSTNFDFSKANSDGSDIRFIDSDDTTKLNYWIEEWDATAQEAKIWVNVTSIPASSTKTIYMYYGNPSASSESNGTAVFEFFDDFEDGDYTDKWTLIGGSASETNGYLEVSSTSSSEGLIEENIKEFSDTEGFIIEGKIMQVTTNDLGEIVFHGDLTKSNLYMFVVGYKDGLRIVKRQGGTDTELASVAQVIDENVWYDFRVTRKPDGTIIGEILGVNSVSATDTSFTSGYVGVRVGGTASDTCRVDNYRVRKYTDPEPTASVGEEEAFYKKDITDSVTTSFSIERLRQVLRETTDEYFVTTVLSRQQSLVRCYGDVLSLYEYLEKQQTLAREYTDIIDMIEKLEKTGLLERKADITIDITDKVLRNIFSDREMYLKIETSAVLTREQALERGTVVTYTVDTEVFRKQNLNRITLIKLTLTPDILRYASIGRDGKILLLIDTYLYKKLSGTRELIQSIDVYLDTLRRAGISKINLLTLEITPELAKILSQNRYTEITLIVTPEVYKQLVRTRSVADAFSLDFVLEKLGEFVRFLRLDSLFSSGIERQGAFGRNILAEFTLSSGILSRYIPVVVGYYNISIFTREYAPGDTVYIFAFIEGANFTGYPKIIIYYPNTTKLVEDWMDLFKDNIYYYTLEAPSVKGDYLVEVIAGNSTFINTFRVSPAYSETGGAAGTVSIAGIEIHTTGDFFYYPGNTVKIPFVITSRTDGKPVDYDSIKITIYNPSMEVIAEDLIPTKISTGIYYVDYNLSDLADYGVYPVIINATYQGYSTARIATFKVLPPAPVELSVETDREQVFQGGSLSAKFTIKNGRYKTEYVTLEYTLYDEDKEEILYKGTTQLILNPQQTTELTRTLYIPLEAPTGLGIVEGKLTLKDSTVFAYAYVTISAGAKGVLKNKYLLTFNNLTPEEQYVEIYRNDTLVFKGLVKKGYSIELEKGTYWIKLYVEGRKPNEFILTLDRDMVIDSQLVEEYPIWYYFWLYRGHIIALITVFAVGWYAFRNKKEIP